MGTSKARINSLEELVAGGTKTHYFDSNENEITVDTIFANELIQKYRLSPNTSPFFVVSNFFTYVNKEGRHFAILLYEWNGYDSEYHDDVGYYSRWFQVIET